jgi:hypothetical protein
MLSRLAKAATIGPLQYSRETGAAAEGYTGELAEARSRAEGGARSRPFTDPVLVLPADRDPMPYTS